jgi:hypothetical protein
MAVNFSRFSVIGMWGITLQIVVCLDLVQRIVLNKERDVLETRPFPFAWVWDQFCFLVSTLLCSFLNKTQCTKYRRWVIQSIVTIISQRWNTEMLKDETVHVSKSQTMAACMGHGRGVSSLGGTRWSQLIRFVFQTFERRVEDRQNRTWE